jgi:hypothetical protein
MPVRTIQTDDDSSFELNSCGTTSSKDATNPSTHEVSEHQENDQPTLPLTIGNHQDNHQDDQSAQKLSVDRLVKYEQNQIADIILASLELPDSKAKPESIDHLYKMIARLTSMSRQSNSADLSFLLANKLKHCLKMCASRSRSAKRATTFRKRINQIWLSHKSSRKHQSSRTTVLAIHSVLVVFLLPCGIPHYRLQGIDRIVPHILSQQVMAVTMEEVAMMMMEMNIMEAADAEGVEEILLLVLVVPVVLLMIQWTQERKAKKMLSNVRW